MIEGSSRIVGMNIASKNKLKISEIVVDSISQCPIMASTRQRNQPNAPKWCRRK
jgi:hypothetical protein